MEQFLRRIVSDRPVPHCCGFLTVPPDRDEVGGVVVESAFDLILNLLAWNQDDLLVAEAPRYGRARTRDYEICTAIAIEIGKRGPEGWDSKDDGWVEGQWCPWPGGAVQGDAHFAPVRDDEIGEAVSIQVAYQ